MGRLLLISLFLFGFTLGYGQKQTIVVHLLFKNKDLSGVNQVTLKQGDKILSTVFTDYEGIVKVSRTSRSSGGYDLFLTTSNDYDLYLTSIKPKTKDTVLVYLPVLYKKRLGKVICPKCGKSNKVIKSEFAGPLPIKKERHRGIIYSPFGKSRNKIADQDPRSSLVPLWYCTRDSILF